MHICSSISMMTLFFNFNGKFLKNGTGIAGPGNRGLRYGDGLFETMSVLGSQILYKDLHFKRLFSGLKVLQFIQPQHFNSLYFENQILALCKKNKIPEPARVRLMIFRGEGGLYDPENHLPNYAIEAWHNSVPDELNRNGLVVDIYHDVKKSCDILSNLKTNNFLPYVLAANFAKKHQLNDALILNTHNRICDSTIANVFAITGNEIITPALSEGCVAGVMREWLIQTLPSYGYIVSETVITVEKLKEAEGVFLTNVIKGIRWVKSFNGVDYSADEISKLFNLVNSKK